MKYVSTRGQAPVLPFDEVLLAGLARDGGLYVPEIWPKFSKAEMFARKTILLNPNLYESHANLGGILKELGKLKEAEISTRKAINLKNDFAPAHYNLGIILNKLGNLEESEISFLKAIEIKPDYAKAYYALSYLSYSDANNWKKNLFSKNILKNQSRSDLVDIYFARANICHKEKNYEESSKFLISANELKLKIQPSNREMLYKKSKKLLLECNNKRIKRKSSAKSPECIFIVGMPRSGSTLIENILSMNPKVTPLGEVNILEESFKDYKIDIEGLPLNEIYLKNIRTLSFNHEEFSNHKCILYFHGGGYIAGSPETHQNLLSSIAEKSKFKVYAIDLSLIHI